MDYETRKVKWYWLLVFIVYCGTVVYVLFQGNPYLYARQDLRSALNVGEAVHRMTIPTHPEAAKIGLPVFHARYNEHRTAVDPETGWRSKNYTEYEKYTVELDGFEPMSVASDTGGFYLTGKGSSALAIGMDGKPLWKFTFKEGVKDRSLSPILIDEANAYLVHPKGEVAALDKKTGEIRWIMNIGMEVVANPFIYKKHLIVPAKSGTAVQMVQLERSNGIIAEDNPTLEIKPGFLLSEAPDLKAFIATVDNKVIALDPEDWQVMWSQILTDPVKGYAVVVGAQIYVATLGAKIVNLDGAKKGKLDWEAEIVKPPAGPPAFIPLAARLAVLDTNGFISSIDANSGKVYWRLPSENKNPLGETWAARLKGNHIEEFKMDWLQKGWTIWSPCYENGFCIYNPAKGQFLTRVRLSGKPVALPQTVDRRWIFLTLAKPGHYLLSHIVEDQEIKKLKAEAKASEGNGGGSNP